MYFAVFWYYLPFWRKLFGDVFPRFCYDLTLVKRMVSYLNVLELSFPKDVFVPCLVNVNLVVLEKKMKTGEVYRQMDWWMACNRRSEKTCSSGEFKDYFYCSVYMQGDSTRI